MGHSSIDVIRSDTQRGGRTRATVCVTSFSRVHTNTHSCSHVKSVHMLSIQRVNNTRAEVKIAFLCVAGTRFPLSLLFTCAFLPLHSMSSSPSLLFRLPPGYAEVIMASPWVLVVYKRLDAQLPHHRMIRYVSSSFT